MYKEIETHEIISFLANQHEGEYRSIKFTDILRFAHELEVKESIVRTSCDLMSIDAFRCDFYRNVRMDEDSLLFERVSEIQDQLDMFAPQDAEYMFFSQIYKEL